MDITRVNNIELKIKNNNIAGISNDDLLYYLYYSSKNKKINPSNGSKATTDYLTLINNSFLFENIFVNKNNYSTIVFSIVGLLIPFYYYFPKMYNVGSFVIIIGLISFFNLASTTSTLYSHFFSKVSYLYYGLTVFIYLIFFILLNQLNHISLFFISAVLSFIIINYIGRLLLLLPIEKNKYNKYSASFKDNNNYTQYNSNIETVCIEVNKRYKLNLPSGNMLYSYLTVFEIKENTTNEIVDFITTAIGPFISVFILHILGNLLKEFKDKKLKDKDQENLSLLPVIGINELSKKYLTCQANYILPDELNIDFLIDEFLTDYKNQYDNTTMNKIIKALRRISGELLERYRPIFYNANNDNDKKNILENIGHNKIFVTLTKYLKDLKNKNFDLSSNGISIDNIREKINTDEDLTKDKKNELIELLNHINNTLIINKYDYNKKNDVELATEVLEHNDNIDNKNKETIKEKKIIEKYIDKFKDNLDIGNGNKAESTLFGYNYNIITYKYISNNIREKSNKIFQIIISLLSTWILFGKSIASPFFLLKVSNNIDNYKYIIEGNNNTLWKIISMGLNLSYFDNVNIKNIKEDNTNIYYSFSFSGLVSILSHFNINILYKTINYILYFYLLSFYNSSVFGLVFNPLYYNIISMIIIIILIFINIKRIKEGNTLFPFDYINKFFKIICIISIILIIIGLIIHFYNKNNNKK
jgi:hypothetical protein